LVIVDLPIYVNRTIWYADSRDDYYLSGASWRRDRDLVRAVEDIEDAFRSGDIEALVDHVDTGARIAVFNREKYQYSLSSNDYLDMTRDAMRDMDTVRFDLVRVREKRSGACVASGVHEYRDGDGATKRVLVSFGLERRDGRWVITQVCTAPDGD
jgi:hypothetical protein